MSTSLSESLSSPVVVTGWAGCVVLVEDAGADVAPVDDEVGTADEGVTGRITVLALVEAVAPVIGGTGVRMTPDVGPVGGSSGPSPTSKPAFNLLTTLPSFASSSFDAKFLAALWMIVDSQACRVAA